MRVPFSFLPSSKASKELRNNKTKACENSSELIVAGEKQLLKRNKYVNLGKRLLNLVKNYQSEGVEILDFLKGVAHNMGNRWKNKRDENEDENNEKNRSKRPRVQ